MKKCKFCGTDVSDEMNFCPSCGAMFKDTSAQEKPVTATIKEPSKAKRPINSGMLAWSIVNSAVGLSSCCFVAPLVTAVLGIISLIFTLLAPKEKTDEAEQSKIKVAKILNIIASGIAVLALLVYFGVIVYIMFEGRFNDFFHYYDIYD